MSSHSGLLRRLQVVLLLAFLAGCAAAPTDAPAGTGDQTARLSAGGFYLHYGFGGYVHLVIDSVDGQSGPRAALSLGSTALTPGDHAVVVVASGMALRTPVRAQLRFTALAGREYRIRGAADKSGGPIRIWLEDLQTGSVIAGTGSAAAPATGRLKAVSIEQAMRATPAQLADGYLAVGLNLVAARATERSGASLTTQLDGTPQRIDAANAAEFVAALEQRLQTYAEAIHRKGFERVDGTYRTAVTAGCARLGFTDAPSTIRQDGFEFVLEQAGTLGALKHRGVVVAAAVALEHAMNSDLHLVGQRERNGITLRNAQAQCTVTLEPA